MNIPQNPTPAQETALRATLATIGPLAFEAVIGQGTPPEVLECGLAAEFNDWIVFENGVYGSMAAGVFEKHVTEVALPRLVYETELATRILDTFPNYRGVGQAALDRFSAETLISTNARTHNVRHVTGMQGA